MRGGSAGFAQGIHLGARGDLELRVGCLLVGRKFHLDHLLDLRWQLLEDFRFRAAQHPGLHAPEQPRPDACRFTRSEWLFIAVLKILTSPEVAGQKEIEE
jgi:hypothetical protein